MEKMTSMLPMRKHKGFTLLEVMIALFVLGGSLFFVMEMFIAGTQGSSFPKNSAIIENLARTKMEEIKNLSFSEVSLGDPESDEKRDKSADAFLPPEFDLSDVNYGLTESDDYIDDGSFPSLHSLPPRMDRITQIKGTENDWLKKIIVTLFYKEKGERNSFQLVSYKANVEKRD